MASPLSQPIPTCTHQAPLCLLELMEWTLSYEPGELWDEDRALQYSVEKFLAALRYPLAKLGAESCASHRQRKGKWAEGGGVFV